MKNILTLLIAALAFTSCVGLPSKPGPTAGVVALKIKFENNTQLNSASTVILHFSSGVPNHTVFLEDGIDYLTNINSSDVYLTGYTVKPADGFTFESYTKELNFPVPFEAGKITIFPLEVRFNQFSHNSMTGTFSFNFALFPLNAQQIEKMWKEIRKEKNYPTWETQ